MLEIINSNTARIANLEADVKGLAISLERVSVEQVHQTELLREIKQATTTPGGDGWIRQAVTPQTVLLLVVFVSSLLGVQLIYPAIPVNPGFVNTTTGK